MTAALMEWETIDADQVKDIMEGRTPRPPVGAEKVDKDKDDSLPRPQAPAIGGPAETT